VTVLEGIDPVLTGELLLHLDSMGHSDSVVIADAHFPAHRICARVVDLPTLSSPRVLEAIRSVVPLDDAPGLDLMESADGELLDVQRELMQATGASDDDVRLIERFAFYEAASGAYLVVRTGETRKYGNAILRKGVVGHPSAGEPSSPRRRGRRS
jgi:L-fucose mutarotase